MSVTYHISFPLQHRHVVASPESLGLPRGREGSGPVRSDVSATCRVPVTFAGRCLSRGVLG